MSKKKYIEWSFSSADKWWKRTEKKIEKAKKPVIIMRSGSPILLIIFCECLFCCVCILYVFYGNEKGVTLISSNWLSVIHIRENFLMSVSNKKQLCFLWIIIIIFKDFIPHRRSEHYREEKITEMNIIEIEFLINELFDNFLFDVLKFRWCYFWWRAYWPKQKFNNSFDFGFLNSATDGRKSYI
jgi:hypothetical protein